MSPFQSVMAKKKLPKSLLDEISVAVVHVRNNYSGVKGKFLFEKYNKQLLDVSDLRVLGY